MTDNKDRFVTPVPDPDDRSPGAGGAELYEAYPVDAEYRSNEPGDIPATPEWEKAFAEYARKQAPDLMPRILEQISAKSDRKTIRKGNRFRIITSLSGVAAAVIVVGILIIMSTRLPRKDNTAVQDDKYATATPTEASNRNESFAPELSPGQRDTENRTSIPGDETGDRVSTPTPTPDATDGLHFEEGPKEEDEIQETVRSLEVRLKSQSLVYGNNGTITLRNVSIGEAICLEDGSSAYRLTIDGTDSGCLILWPEAETGRTYSAITFYYNGVREIGGEKYYLCSIANYTE